MSNKLSDLSVQEMEKLYDMLKIAVPSKWLKMYEDYQQQLTREDVSAFWEEQYRMCNAQRNNLKNQANAKR